MTACRSINIHRRINERFSSMIYRATYQTVNHALSTARIRITRYVRHAVDGLSTIIQIIQE